MKINWGLIGLGNISNIFGEAFQNTKNSNLLAIASKNDQRLNTFKQKYFIESNFCFKDYERLIKCDKVDVVYISLPNSFHKEWIDKCLFYKKKFLVEKPAFNNFKDAKEVEDKILKEENFFSEGFMYKFNPQFKKIIELVRNNEIGKIISIKSTFGVNLITKKKFFFFEKKRKIDPKGRLFSKKLGGGCILDLGCYPISFSTSLISLQNEINFEKFVIVNCKKEVGETGVDIDSRLEYIFDNEINVEVASSFKKNIGRKSIIKGTKGTIIVDDTWIDGKTISLVKDNNKKEYKFDNTINPYTLEIDNVSQSILNKSNCCLFPGTTFNETLINTKILNDWIYEKK